MTLLKNILILLILAFLVTYPDEKELTPSNIHDTIKVTKGYLKECTGIITKTYEEFGKTQHRVKLTCGHLYKSGVIKRTYTLDYFTYIDDEKLY